MNRFPQKRTPEPIHSIPLSYTQQLKSTRLKHIPKIRILLIRQVFKGLRVPLGFILRKGVAACVLAAQEGVEEEGEEDDDAVTR